eukprot:CAMPEP_0179424708 /NCGR_PEP_ID=MMETSP0799-20121207/11751_1 /TAXON_ID=46947 /ORGANISM="Geminigera cryophila, Strain CCMP2564" /LENGTH=55 /DNA_ID=CAMNT_0021199215 /DNA_START=400 /DNA_END=567 /DNA_ORIENTATION=-
MPHPLAGLVILSMGRGKVWTWVMDVGYGHGRISNASNLDGLQQVGGEASGWWQWD